MCKHAGIAALGDPHFMFSVGLATMGVSMVSLVLVLVELSLCSPAFSYSDRLWKRQNDVCNPTPANLQESFQANCTGMPVSQDSATCDRAWMNFTRAFARKDPATVVGRLVYYILAACTSRWT